MKKEKLESLYIDVENGVYRLNGEDIGDATSELHLDFENGEWSLMVTKDSIFSTSDATVTE